MSSYNVTDEWKRIITQTLFTYYRLVHRRIYIYIYKTVRIQTSIGSSFVHTPWDPLSIGFKDHLVGLRVPMRFGFASPGDRAVLGNAPFLFSHVFPDPFVFRTQLSLRTSRLPINAVVDDYTRTINIIRTCVYRADRIRFEIS